MSVIKLEHKHSDAVKDLFYVNKYMGIDTSSWHNPMDLHFNEVLYNIFCDNYLSNLSSFHAYGFIEDDKVKALITFYESHEEPAWYYTLYRSSGNNNLLRDVLDSVISYNELNGRYKFYTLTNAKHTQALRRFHWSKYNDARYDYIDEYLVPAKTKCIYENAWELLYKKTLLPEDSIVRCNYLKQEFRPELIIGGNI